MTDITPMTDTRDNGTDIVSRLNDIWSDDDHDRGCQGRTYSCTCGFDERTFATAKEAASEILSLRQKNDDLNRECEATMKEIAELRKEIELLRKIVSDSASALGNGAVISPECTIGFMQYLPKEIALYTGRLRQQLDEARERNLLATERADNAQADAEKARDEARGNLPVNIDDHEAPRYTTKRMHYEIAQARNKALDEAAEAVGKHNCAGREWSSDSFWGQVTNEAVSRIRALKEKGQ